MLPWRMVVRVSHESISPPTESTAPAQSAFSRGRPSDRMESRGSTEAAPSRSR
jgi:hypothetical protein